MALAPSKWINELQDMLAHHIDSGQELDVFSYRKIVSQADKIPDDPLRLMILALASGAAGKNDDALFYFKEGVKYRDDIVARNYLSYLSHTGQYELYREEAVKLAKQMDSFPLFIRARNAAYASGDAELSLFFARKAMSMTGDEQVRARMECEIKVRDAMLNDFMRITNLSTEEISTLTMTVAGIARKYGVLAVAHDYYTSDDGDAAIICDVLCLDDDMISDMDIDIATELAVSDTFSDKNITAWFRGKDKSEVPAPL
ncbi:hypothetical protein [Serratia marcescens]|uniref:hypothetical protein n=1 Tax=Serratia marcescens TaxID=615 RepID=UPI00320490A5